MNTTFELLEKEYQYFCQICNKDLSHGNKIFVCYEHNDNIANGYCYLCESVGIKHKYTMLCKNHTQTHCKVCIEKKTDGKCTECENKKYN